MTYVSHFIELKLKLLAKILNHFRPSSYHVYKTKDASNAPVLFFLFSIANGLGWLHYGSLIGNFNLITLNGIGLALNSAYVILYLIYSPDWTSFSYKFTALLAYFSALYYHLYWLSSHDEFVRHLGASCCRCWTSAACWPAATPAAPICRSCWPAPSAAACGVSMDRPLATSMWCCRT
ncbi:hypothetical protein BOX15_Mlig016650g1 [Macrostomum lignano]|uniref:Uncharacterized protein n=1 Tax=Macrostomum lignano TaxID=282301 RepID=A0A267DJJ6_9PLAT|nr:hypothetical protein BOX15_Mlig016650g1 [Macrostomum lignano]